ncbi:ribosomal large subunit pseudouridine synthase B [Natranaerovirga hydrolytica]|uniref:Pseudouridine synthase n=1 Tax=Natranaerovirga hydrolytica TaxID=680378 RepID=A0A4V2Q1K4_9FIRM|nr:pseudouridine synthase [Natranaerovirga hydrolytica]TCK97981.1 ribosomal large subunit pseudouridine synthase B [Natranaerovirga hydrolytica]
MEVRLQKYLADAGVASRRKSEELITSGWVKVNDKVVKELGTKVNPDKDVIKYKDKVISHKEKLVYYVLNKPVGYISSVTDPRHRKTVVDLIKEKERVFPVGRLDYDSEGLLIITNDGDLTYKLTHPKHHIPKQYIVKVKGHPSEDKISKLRIGVALKEFKTSKCKIRLLKKYNKGSLYEVILFEGKNRQIRKMFDYIGHPVITLKRIAIGEIELEDLKTGEYRKLTREEIKYLKSV